jgi:DoxX-like family
LTRFIERNASTRSSKDFEDVVNRLLIRLGAPTRIGVHMHRLAVCAQLIIAFSIVLVWIVRFPNVVKEFHEYHLPDFIRTLVGGTKIALATLLVTGIWYPNIVLVSALLMAVLMICAQIAHVRAHHPWHKYVPSLVLLGLSLFVGGVHGKLFQT